MTVGNADSLLQVVQWGRCSSEMWLKVNDLDAFGLFVILIKLFHSLVRNFWEGKKVKLK